MAVKDQDFEEEGVDERERSANGEEGKGGLEAHAIKGITLAASRPDGRERQAH